MNYHPDVLAAHAEFGGDLQAMQALYDRPDHVARIAALEAQLAELEAEVERLKDRLGDPDGTIAHADAIISQAATLSRTGAVKVTEAMVEAGLEYYAEGGCGGLADYERREVVEAIIEAALKAAMEAGG